MTKTKIMAAALAIMAALVCAPWSARADNGPITTTFVIGHGDGIQLNISGIGSTPGPTGSTPSPTGSTPPTVTAPPAQLLFSGGPDMLPVEDTVAAVPEPSTGMLLAFGLVALVAARRHVVKTEN